MCLHGLTIASSTLTQTGAGDHGWSLSGCTADSKQDVAATPDSRNGRRQPQRRAAQVAAQITAQVGSARRVTLQLFEVHTLRLRYMPCSAQSAAKRETTAPQRLLQQPSEVPGAVHTALRAVQAAADEGPDVGLARADSGSRSDDDNDDLDMDMDLEFDSDGLPGSGKPAQKRQRRRVVVEPRDASGRLYTPAEIRRMKRCAALPQRHALPSARLLVQATARKDKDSIMDVVVRTAV